MELEIASLEQLPQVAAEFMAQVGTAKVFAFHGEMGAGKTTFIKALCRELGSLDAAASPTFSLVNVYKTKFSKPIYHFDFYRINKETEALDMGVEEYFYSGNYCFIEWPEKIPNYLPIEAIHVYISLGDTSRLLKF